MREIAKLVAVNSPDLVLFVGEALTGNDGVDQVQKFNRSLVDMSYDRNRPRGRGSGAIKHDVGTIAIIFS